MNSRSKAWKLLAALLIALPLMAGCTGRSIIGDMDKTGSAKRIKIWFVKPGEDSLELIAVNRQQFAAQPLEEAVSELLRGPTDEEMAAGISSEIPRGTILLGIDGQDGELELNLSRRFASGGGTSSVTARLEQLSRTVAGVAGDKKVYLAVEGKRMLTTPGEGLEVKQPLN